MNNDQSLSGRTILIAAGDSRAHEIAVELERHAARVIECPPVEIAEAQSYTALDEAIDNLFGYDWLLCRHPHAADFFLRRFVELGDHISELDALRVCAVGDSTAEALERAQVHVDLVTRIKADEIKHELENFRGEADSLRGVNFLVPSAVLNVDGLPEKLRDAGSRVDIVAAYQTTAASALLTQISTLLVGGGIDCVVFIDSQSVHQLAVLLDTNDIPTLLADVRAACFDHSAKNMADAFGLSADIAAHDLNPADFANAIADLLGKSEAQSSGAASQGRVLHSN